MKSTIISSIKKKCMSINEAKQVDHFYIWGFFFKSVYF